MRSDVLHSFLGGIALSAATNLLTGLRDNEGRGLFSQVIATLSFGVAAWAFLKVASGIAEAEKTRQVASAPAGAPFYDRVAGVALWQLVAWISFTVAMTLLVMDGLS